MKTRDLPVDVEHLRFQESRAITGNHRLQHGTWRLANPLPRREEECCVHSRSRLGALQRVFFAPEAVREEAIRPRKTCGKQLEARNWQGNFSREAAKNAKDTRNSRGEERHECSWDAEIPVSPGQRSSHSSRLRVQLLFSFQCNPLHINAIPLR